MPDGDINKLIQLQEETVKLLLLLVRKDVLQSHLIQQLAEAGFRTSRIAELVGTTSNTVNVTIQKAKRRKKQ